MTQPSVLSGTRNSFHTFSNLRYSRLRSWINRFPIQTTGHVRLRQSECLSQNISGDDTLFDSSVLGNTIKAFEVSVFKYHIANYVYTVFIFGLYSSTNHHCDVPPHTREN